MNGSPFQADALKNKSHAARRSVRLIVEGLRLRPHTGNHGPVAAEHRHVTIASVELDVFALRKRTLAIFLELIPSFSHAAVVIEENQLRRIPIAAHVQVNI